VTKNGTSIVLPVKHKYIEPHCLYISVPDPEGFTKLVIRNDTLDFNFRSENGTLEYQFISDGKILGQGTTIKPHQRYSTESRTSSSFWVLKLDLPYKGNLGDLELHLKVIEPMTFLSEYSGNITCFLRPKTDYK